MINTNLVALASDLIVIENYTYDNISISSGTYLHDYDISKNGYTPLLCNISLDNATTSGSQSSACYVYRQLITENSLDVAIRATNTAKIKIMITVLYKKANG